MRERERGVDEARGQFLMNLNCKEYYESCCIIIFISMYSRPWNDHLFFALKNPSNLHIILLNESTYWFILFLFQVSKGRQNTAVKEQLYKSPVKKEQSSIWSEPIMADFPYPFVMRKALLIGVSIVWNHGLWESSMQGNLSHKIFFFKTCMGFYYYSMCNKYKIR